MPAQKRPKTPRAAPQRDMEPGRHYVADEPVGEVDSPDATVQSPTTDSGEPVEDQVHKEWDPKKQGGLPTFLKTRARTGTR